MQLLRAPEYQMENHTQCHKSYSSNERALHPARQGHVAYHVEYQSIRRISFSSQATHQ